MCTHAHLNILGKEDCRIPQVSRDSIQEINTFHDYKDTHISLEILSFKTCCDDFDSYNGLIPAQHGSEASETQAQTWVRQGSEPLDTFQKAGLLVVHCNEFYSFPYYADAKKMMSLANRFEYVNRLNTLVINNAYE